MSRKEHADMYYPLVEKPAETQTYTRRQAGHLVRAPNLEDVSSNPGVNMNLAIW